MRHPSNAPPFFIVGSARSGTTLLRLILNAHPVVAVPPESRFIVELWPGTDTIERPRFLDALGSHRRFQAWDLPLDAVASELPKDDTIPFSEAVSAPFRAFAAARGKSRWGDKTPRYVEQIPLLHRLFPDGRFVHIIRDGRNVALSYADVPFGPKTIGKAAVLWSDRVAAGMREGRALGPSLYREIHYEDLVENVEAETKELCEFLNLEFDPAMLDYTERSRSDVLPRAKSYNPNVTKKPIARVRSWEEKMSDGDVAIFESIAGPVLAEVGYHVRNQSPSAGTRFAATLSRLGLLGRLERGKGSAG